MQLFCCGMNKQGAKSKLFAKGVEQSYEGKGIYYHDQYWTLTAMLFSKNKPNEGFIH